MNLKTFLSVKKNLHRASTNEKVVAVCAALIAIWSLNSVYSWIAMECLMEMSEPKKGRSHRQPNQQEHHQSRSDVSKEPLHTGNSSDLPCQFPQGAIKNKGKAETNFIVLSLFFLPCLLHIPDSLI